MPQLRQGSRIMLGFAVAGSKFDGTGLTNEQIVQTHVALLGRGVLEPEPRCTEGFPPLCMGEALELRAGDRASVWTLKVVDRLRLWIGRRLVALGWRMTFGEDLNQRGYGVSAPI